MTTYTTNLLDFSSKSAIVTGAASGIGRACARLLAHAGAEVVALDADAAGLEKSYAEVDNVTTAVADVADLSRVQAAVGTMAFDVALNAAGVMIRKDLTETSPDDWNRVISVNLTGYFNVLKAIAPHMPDGSAIIQIASITAHLGYRYPAYSATKGAILALTRQLARELGPRGIRVNSISPGVIVTGLNDTYFADPEHATPTISQTPLSRLGAPEDIANVALFMASPLASFITGEDILVDGGLGSTAHF
ncbi:SDR family NAD(P)-dependent oxidoreductase [Mycobacterium deserti]|uniref:SDR family oxidoreductase n=1 Tax=Mycobacterium deserti TaxID=2978347 RepID=A0ABT2MEK4_9MYCO|nr:SDR family oxidoreductase [Mycobacterium deserti]MCT7660713.1 SDR family oxidoreductase [Mycobacterium deserti]